MRKGKLVEARELQPLEIDLLALYEQIPIGPLCSFLLYNPTLYEAFVRSIFDILKALYEAGLIDKRTRANLLKSIIGAIAAILERHPDCIAHLLDRIDDALSRNMHAEAAEYLFSKLPLDI